MSIPNSDGNARRISALVPLVVKFRIKRTMFPLRNAATAIPRNLSRMSILWALSNVKAVVFRLQLLYPSVFGFRTEIADNVQYY